MSSNESENSRQNDSGSSGKVAAQRKRDVQHFRENFISDKPNLMLRSCFETSNSMAIYSDEAETKGRKYRNKELTEACCYFCRPTASPLR